MSQGTELPKVISPSPNVAALQKYGEIPVNNYTGVPSNTIPLYTIKSGDIEIPISVSYHSSGVRVTDEASWVGLGWALNAGGVITRQVRGMDDFGPRGYLESRAYSFPNQSGNFTIISNYQRIKYSLRPYDPNYPPSIHEVTTPEMKALSGGYISSQVFNGNGRDSYGYLSDMDPLVFPEDGEPDIYHYNFLGYSGKLIIGKNAGIIKIVSSEQDKLSFTYNNDTRKWIVKDIKGFEYEFGVTEYSRSRQRTCQDSDDYISETSITGWYINKIKSPKGDEVTFEYLYDSPLIGGVSVISQNGVEEQGNLQWKKTPPPGDTKSYLGLSAAGSPCNSNFMGGSYKRITKNYTENYEKYLKRISFKEGYVEFNMGNADRADRVKGFTNSNTIGALDNITVYDKNNNSRGNFRFITSYFNQDKISLANKQDYLRLKLDGIISYSASNNPQMYRFQYSEIPLPSKITNSVDNWGYYNGANNNNIINYELYPLPSSSYSFQVFGNSYARNNLSTLIPSYDYFDNDIIVNMNGADRNPNKDFIQAGILKTIYYPTGGKTKFEYEPNTYYKSDGKGLSETSYFASALGDNETSFWIHDKSFVKIEYRFDNNTGYGQEEESSIYNKIWNTYVALEKQDGTQKIRFFPARDFSNPNYPAPDGTFTKHTLSYFTVLLEPGNYKLKANNGGFVYFTLDLKAIVQNKYISINQLGAGLRVKSIQNIDGTGKIQEKQFSYNLDNGNSSGNIMSPIFNFYNATSYMEGYMSSPPSIARNEDMESTFIISLKNPIIKRNRSIPNYIEASGSSFLPLGNSAAGQSIGYSQVTITNVDPFPFSSMKNLGKSIYKYNNFPDTLYGAIVPYVKKDKQHDENGQLINEYHYDRTNKLLSEKEYKYGIGNTFKVNGLRIMRSSSPYCFVNPIGTFGNGFFPCDEMIMGVLFDRFYEDEIHWWTPNQVIEKNYPSGGGDPIVTTKNFTYENLSHKQLTKEETIFPDATLKKTYRYADEEGNQLMKTKNMIGIPLISETQKTANGSTKTLQKVENYYPKEASETTNTNGLILPLWTKTYGLDNLTVPNTFLTYDRYDSKGNILQYSEKGLKPTTFIWGYDQTLPIAKIEGINYIDLASKLGFPNTADGYKNLSIVSKSDLDKDQGTENILITELDAFRKEPNLTGYQTSTYTYNPLIGLTSITLPSGQREAYKYDDNNRLKQIEDINGNILKENKYNYSNGMAGDINTIGEILGNITVGVFTGQNSHEIYKYDTKNMPGYYYWYIEPTSGVLLSNTNNSAVANVTFTENAQASYILYGTGLNTITGENLTLSKKINVYNIVRPATGSTSFTAYPNIQIMSSGIYLNGTTISGYFVFKPGIFNDTKDIAMISSDKTPSIDRVVNYHEVSTGIDRDWIFTFKPNGVVSASYTGTPLTNDTVINVSSFQYQK